METWRRRRGGEKSQCRLPELSRGLICLSEKLKSKVLLDPGKILEGVAQAGWEASPFGCFRICCWFSVRRFKWGRNKMEPAVTKALVKAHWQGFVPWDGLGWSWCPKRCWIWLKIAQERGHPQGWILIQQPLCIPALPDICNLPCL